MSDAPIITDVTNNKPIAKKPKRKKRKVKIDVRSKGVKKN